MLILLNNIKAKKNFIHIFAVKKKIMFIKNLNTIVLLCIPLTTIYSYSMDIALPQLPEDISQKIIDLRFFNITKESTGIPQARQAFIHLTEINKHSYSLGKNKVIINHFIQELSQKFGQSSIEIAQKLRTSYAKEYITLNIQLFNKDLTPEHIKELHVQGADLKCTHDAFNNNIPWPVLYFWSSHQSNNYENTQQMLALGADVNSRCDGHSCLSNRLDSMQFITLFLSYKPSESILNSALKDAIENNNSKEIINLIITAIEKNILNTQRIMNTGLYNSMVCNQKEKTELIKFFLEKNAQPEHVINTLLYTVLLSIMKQQTQNAVPIQTPSLEILELLCSYPIRDITQVEKARNKLQSINHITQVMLNILDTCVTK